MTIRKRFIAGAVCPSCQQQDSLVMWREQQPGNHHTVNCNDTGYVDIVECVKCGHQMRKTDHPAATVQHNWQQQLIDTKVIET